MSTAKDTDPRGTMTFACGARFVHVQDPRPFASHTKRDGRVRWVVYDSEPGVQSPKLDGEDAPCRFRCPCKRAGGRKEWKGFPPDYDEKREEYERTGVWWQRWVTCYGTWLPAEINPRRVRLTDRMGRRSEMSSRVNLRDGEPDDEPRAAEPSLVAQDRAEDLLCEFVADHPPQDLVIRLARHLEIFAAEWMDAAKVYAAPPWLSDVAEALGMARPSDGAPLAINWHQALEEIRDQRESLAETKLDLQRLMGDERIEQVIKERDAGRAKISGLLDAAERLLEHFSDGLPDHLVEEFRDAVTSARKP